jgi:hypothetical protein
VEEAAIAWGAEAARRWRRRLGCRYDVAANRHPHQDMQMTEAVDNWEDDLLDRKQYADFLTAYLERKCVPGASGIVIALDAPWGLGKSFFVKRWAADLIQAGRAVVTFDAWENDSAEAPVISFMGELRKSLRPLQGKVPKSEAVKQKVEKKTSEVVSNLRKATLPALAVMSKAVLRKTTGIALDELMDAIQGEGNPEEAFDEAVATAPDALEKGLDAFFDKALQGHTQRLESVKAFRQSLEELLDTLHREGLAEGPLYVFIDELDRCRPDYAIRLLEGIKHLFSVKGVAFVVSTNLVQLGNAVGAVYGPSFDGFRYLKRFFDFEYELPQPTRMAFIQAQVVGTALQGMAGPSGLDPRGKSANDETAAFASVAQAMSLDLRSLQRVMAIADAAVSGAPKGSRFVALWLFFLSALRYLQPDEFVKVATKSLDDNGFVQMARGVMNGPQLVTFTEVSERGQYGAKAETNLPAVLVQLYSATKLSARELNDQISHEDSREAAYPHVLRHVVADTWRIVSNAPHPLNQHANLIAAAGHISRPASDT